MSVLKTVVSLNLITAIFLLIAPLSAAGESISALSEASSDIVMSFTVAGRVKNIPVKEGQAVKEGDLLIELNAEALEARLKQLSLEAENDAEIMASEAELKQKRQDLIKLEHAYKKGAATKIELEHARLDVEISEYRLLAAQHTKAVAWHKKEEIEAEVREYRLLSPISGVVEKLEVATGETAKTSEDAVRLVGLDPLWVETDAPVAQFEYFTLGREIKIIFPGEVEMSGLVVFRGAVADSASDTVRVRLKVANPSHRHAGERVILSLP